MVVEERPDWLPKGWTMGVRTTRSGLMHPYYVSLESGRIVSSKKDVLKYMNNEKPTEHASRGSLQYVEDKKQILQAESLTDWLPNGWILEIKAPKWGRRKYKVQAHIQHLPESIHKEYSKEVKFKKITMKKAGIQGQPHPAASQEKNLEGTLKRCSLSGEQDTNIEDVKTRKEMVSVSENTELIFKGQSVSDNVNWMPFDPSDRVLLKVGKLVNESTYMREIKQRDPDHNAPLEEKLDGRGVSLSSSGELDLNLPYQKSNKKVERHGRKSKAQKSNLTPLRASKRRARSEAYSDLSVQLGATSDKEFDRISKIESRKPKIKKVLEKTGEGKTNDLQVPEWESWSDPCIKFAFKTLTSDISFLNNTLSIEQYLRQQLASIDSSCSNGSATNNGKLTTENNVKSSGNGLKNFFDLNNICQSTGSQED